VRYARAAVRDEAGERHGRWLRLAAARFLWDLARARRGTAGFGFDPWSANDACEFIEKLPHVEGTWESPTLRLHDSQVFLVAQVFGFRNRGGGRRFTGVLLNVARKYGKSTLAAAILLYCLCCEDEAGAQVITAAKTGQQARIVFSYAKRMVEQTPDLREWYGLEPFANAIARWQIGGTFKPINAKASSQDGLNPSHCVLDEIHAHQTHDLLNVLRSAAGARANPLWLYTTSEGYETPGPWPDLRAMAQNVLLRTFEADHFLALIFALDDDDAEFDETRWVKANPVIGSNAILLREVRKEAAEARQMPGHAAEFRIKRLNRRSAAAKSWVDLERWRACAGAVDLEALRDRDCWAGLDLASTKDLCALRLVWPVDGIWFTWGWRWVPALAVAQRTERGTVPYASWVAQGLIKQTEGEVADYAEIERDIDALCERFLRIKEIAFDPWNATELSSRMMEKSRIMVAFRQGAKSYHPAMQALERIYYAKMLRHGGDPVLTWCAANLVPRFDPNMNMAPDRQRSGEKIDDMAALLMAIGRAVAGGDQSSVYDTRGVIAL